LRRNREKKEEGRKRPQRGLASTWNGFCEKGGDLLGIEEGEVPGSLEKEKKRGEVRQ